MLMFDFEGGVPSNTELTAAALIADLSIVDWNTLKSMESYVFDDKDADFLLSGTDADLEALNEIIEDPALLESLSYGLIVDERCHQQLQQTHQHQQHLEHQQQVQTCEVSNIDLQSCPPSTSNISAAQSYGIEGQKPANSGLRKRPLFHGSLYHRASQPHQQGNSVYAASSTESTSSMFCQQSNSSTSKSLQSFHTQEQFSHPSITSKSKPHLEELWDYFSFCQNQISSHGGPKTERRSSHHVLNTNRTGDCTQYRCHGSMSDIYKFRNTDEPPEKLLKLRQSSLDEGFVSPPEFSSVTDQEANSEIKSTTDGGYISSIHSPKSSPATPGTSTQTTESAQSPIFSSSTSKISGKETQMCSVCGDNAVCLHYGVRTCEGCKGFFKRTVQKGAKYSCLADKRCPVDKRRRNRCQFCRFQKCLAVGMQREVVRMNSLKGRRGRLPSRGNTSQMGSFEFPPMNIATELVKAHIERTAGSSQNVKNEKNSACVSLEVTQQFYCTLSQTFELFQNWSNRVPDFADLLLEDQNLLFTSAFLELFSFQIAKNIISKDDLIFLGNGVHIGPTRLPESFKPWTDAIYQLSEALRRLSLDTTSAACIEALILITDRYGLREPQKVEHLQTKICESLRDHIENTYDESSKRSPVLSHILGKLPQLRTLSHESVHLLRRLGNIKNKTLPPIFVKDLYLSDTCPI